MKIEEGVELAAVHDARHGRPGARLRAARVRGGGRGASRLGAAARDSRVAVVGLGSNLLAADDGVDALVLKLGGELAAVEVDGDVAESGGRSGERGRAAPRPRRRARRLRVRVRDPGHDRRRRLDERRRVRRRLRRRARASARRDGRRQRLADSGRARAELPALGAPARSGRAAGRAAAAAPAARGDQGRGTRAERAPQGGAADEPAHVRQRLQEPGARAERGPDARGVRPEGLPRSAGPRSRRSTRTSSRTPTAPRPRTRSL